VTGFNPPADRTERLNRKFGSGGRTPDGKETWLFSYREGQVVSERGLYGKGETELPEALSERPDFTLNVMKDGQGSVGMMVLGMWPTPK